MLPKFRNGLPSEHSLVHEATELLSLADVAAAEQDYVSAAMFVEAAYQAFDDAAAQSQSAPAHIERPELARAYATTH